MTVVLHSMASASFSLLRVLSQSVTMGSPSHQSAVTKVVEFPAVSSAMKWQTDYQKPQIAFCTSWTACIYLTSFAAVVELPPKAPIQILGHSYVVPISTRVR